MWPWNQLNRIEAYVRAIYDRVCNIELKIGVIIVTQAELKAELDKVQLQLVKIGGETSTLLTKIEELEAAILAAPVTPEVQAAMAAVTAQAQIVDDLNPDVPPTP